MVREQLEAFRLAYGKSVKNASRARTKMVKK